MGEFACKGCWNLGTACGKCQRCIDGLPAYHQHLNDKIDGLSSDINGLVEAVAARSVNRGGASPSTLYDYVAVNYPKLWRRFNGGAGYLREDREPKI